MKLGVLGLHAFQLDGHLLSDGDVGTWTGTEGTQDVNRSDAVTERFVIGSSVQGEQSINSIKPFLLSR